MDATQYNRYRDTMNDWYTDKGFAYGAYQDAVNQGNLQIDRDYNSMWDNINFNNSNYWNEKDWNATQEQIALENSRKEQADAEEDVKWYIANGQTPPPELVEKSGIPQETVDALLAQVLGGGISSGGGGSRGGGSGTTGVGTTGTGTTGSTSWTKGLSDLGLGSVYNSNLLVDLDEAGAITESNGKLSWNSGWNASNYKNKLNQSKKWSILTPLGL